MRKKAFYDVCNDYSLSERENAPNDMTPEWVVDIDDYSNLYFYNEHEELVYFWGDAATFEGEE
jgi:hypothetical protein